MENRNGLAVAEHVTPATGHGGARGALEMTEALPQGATLGVDKTYDAEAFVNGLKSRNLVPHVAINGTVSNTGKVRKTAVPDDVAAARATRSAFAAASGSMKSLAGARRQAGFIS